MIGQNKTREDLKLGFVDIKETIITISRDTSNDILLPLDIGKFVSGTFEDRLKRFSFSTEFITSLEKDVKDFVSLLYEKKMSFDEREKSFVN